MRSIHGIKNPNEKVKLDRTSGLPIMKSESSSQVSHAQLMQEMNSRYEACYKRAENDDIRIDPDGGLLNFVNRRSYMNCIMRDIDNIRTPMSVQDLPNEFACYEPDLVTELFAGPDLSESKPFEDLIAIRAHSPYPELRSDLGDRESTIREQFGINEAPTAPIFTEPSRFPIEVDDPFALMALQSTYGNVCDLRGTSGFATQAFCEQYEDFVHTRFGKPPRAHLVDLTSQTRAHKPPIAVDSDSDSSELFCFEPVAQSESRPAHRALNQPLRLRSAQHVMPEMIVEPLMKGSELPLPPDAPMKESLPPEVLPIMANFTYCLAGKAKAKTSQKRSLGIDNIKRAMMEIAKETIIEANVEAVFVKQTTAKRRVQDAMSKYSLDSVIANLNK